MSLLLTTTVTTTINDLIDTTNTGAVFTHPVVDFDLMTKWDTENIRNSADLQAAVTAGDVTLTFNGNPVLDISNFGLSMVLSNLYHAAGRVHCFTDNRWVTDSDDNYGLNIENWNENCGTGVDPNIEWEHHGLLLPAGRMIQRLHIIGNNNNATNVTDMEIFILYKYPNPITRWETGVDNDAEDTEVTLWRDFWVSPTGGTTFTGNPNDMHGRTIDINYITPELGFLSVYFRPVGTITATRYYRMGMTWEIA